MDSPLLASDEDDTPLLSSGPPDETEESGLALLMRRPSSHVPTQAASLEVHQQPQQQRPEVSVVTIVAGTLALVQCSLVWGSYLSNSWTETHLHTAVGWQEKYLPALNNYTDTVIQVTDLASIVSILRASNQNVMLVVIIITAVLIPCVSMILYPAIILRHYHYGTFQKTILLDLLVPFSFVVVYLLVILDLATSFIVLEWTDTTLSIHNRMRNGLLCYLLGMTVCMVVVVFLRVAAAFQKRRKRRQAPQQPLQQRTTPPMSAFRYSWPDMASVANNDQVAPLMRPPVHTNTVMNATDDNDDTPERRETMKCCAWQLGLISLVLLIPSFALPLLRTQYDGIASEFMSSTQQDLYLWQIPWLLWQHGVAASTSKSMLVTCGTILIFQVLVLPLVVLVYGLKKPPRSWLLSCLQPFMTGTTMAVTAALFSTTLEPVAQYLLDQESTGFCATFDHTLGASCLKMSATTLDGTWCFLAHSVFLHVFMLATK